MYAIMLCSVTFYRVKFSTPPHLSLSSYFVGSNQTKVHQLALNLKLFLPSFLPSPYCVILPHSNDLMYVIKICGECFIQIETSFWNHIDHTKRKKKRVNATRNECGAQKSEIVRDFLW